jgi:hypothetical protein
MIYFLFALAFIYAFYMFGTNALYLLLLGLGLYYLKVLFGKN